MFLPGLDPSIARARRTIFLSRLGRPISMLLLALCLPAVSVSALGAEPPRDLDRRATALLEAAGDALAAARYLEYDFEWRGTHLNQGWASGHVKLERGDARADLRFLADVEIGLSPSAGALRSHPRRFRIARDAEGVTRWDLDAEVVERAERHAGTLGLSLAIFTAPQLFRDPAFGIEIEGPELSRLVGRAQAGGVECDVVYLRFPSDSGLGEQYFYFGREDRLLRRAQQIVGPGDGTTPGAGTLTWIFELNRLRASAAAPLPHPWTLELPPDLEILDFDARRPAVGRPAPSWKLPLEDGGTLSSSELGGQVQVLTFWATWCPFCGRAMPWTEEVRRELVAAGEPVEFLALQVWDEEDPSAFLGEVGWQGRSLVDADEVAAAFQVGSTPTIIVVDAEGIVRARLGGGSNADDLRKALQEALEE